MNNDNWILVSLLICVAAGLLFGFAVSRRIYENNICTYHCEKVHGKKPDNVGWASDACQCQYTYGEPK